METYSFYLMIAALAALSLLGLALAAKSLSDFVLDKWRHSRPCMKWGFVVSALLAALYGGSKQATVSYPKTEEGQAYLTNNGSSVTNDAVTLNFTRSSLVPDSAWLYLDCYPLSVTNAEDVAANCVTVYSNQFADISLPLTVAYENATNYNWIAYTDWTPGPVVHTNGVVNVAWLKAKGEMPPNAVRVVPLRTEVNPINAETEEERAWRVYAPDLAFEIDLSLVATNTMTMNWARVGCPWSGTAKIDWGDGTVETGITVGVWGGLISHVYPDMGKYVIRMSPVPYPFYWQAATTKAAVTRVLRFGDADQNPSTESGKRVSEFAGCANLREFPDGTLARWPDGYGYIGSVYKDCPLLAATELPEWPESVKSISETYRSTAIKARVPQWPKALKTASWVYRSDTGLYGAVPPWPDGVKTAAHVFQLCTGLTGTIPAWPDSLTDASVAYYGCTGLTGEIPAWGAAVQNASYTYYGCTGLTGAWTDDPALLMPTNITSHAWCVDVSSAALRALFYSDWGGTRTKPAEE